MVSIVREGTLYMYSSGGQGFTFQAKNLIATLYLSDTGSFPVPGFYNAGDSVNISGNLSGDQTLRHGPAYFNNKSYTRLWYEGSLMFNATPFALPPNSAEPLTLHTPFSFEGNLKAFEANNIFGGGGPAVFNLSFSGRGRATAIFSATGTAGCTVDRCMRALFFYFTPCHRFSFRHWLNCNNIF